MSSFPWLYLVAWITSVAIIIWRYERTLKDLRSRLTDTKHRGDFLEEELASCRKKLGNDYVVSQVTNEQDAKAGLDQIFDGVTLVEFPKDDLKIVEGIGPKIEKIFHESNIFTFADLAATATEDIKKILEKAGSRYVMHDPTTWPKQAKLAKDGRWDELKKWQSELDKGRIVK